MTIRYHTDEHVPGAVIDQLRRRGIDVTTPDDAGLSGESDEDELAFAHAEHRVMVTRDTDYLRLHTRGTPRSGIIFYRDYSRIIGRLVAVLTHLHRQRSAESMMGTVEYL